MIEEEYVSYETSKLLKEAGLPQDEFWKAYNSEGIFYITPFEIESDSYAAPTQSEAMRWLREHEVVVIVDVEYFRYDIKNAKYRYNIYPNDCAKQTRSQYTYPTYEAAAEAGIQAACKYLIEEGGEA